MAYDDIRDLQSGNSNLPPLNYPDNNSDYREPYDKITTDVPKEQPIVFYLGHNKASYLPRSETMDESNHMVPQTIFNPSTKARILPVAYLRQGEASGTVIHFKIYDDAGPADLSQYKMFSTRGNDSKYDYIVSDNGFDTINANLGELDWTPEEAVALTAGKYHTIQLVIESEDRVTRSITLDFDLHIIPNDVAFPRPMAFYISEYQRALFNIGKMQAAADKHVGYMINFVDQVTMDALASYKEQIDKSMDDFQSDLDSKKNQLSKLETDATNLSQKESTFEENLNTTLNGLRNQMKLLGLVTKSDLSSTIVDLGNSGKLDFNDGITSDAQTVLSQWEKEE